MDSEKAMNTHHTDSVEQILKDFPLKSGDAARSPSELHGNIMALIEELETDVGAAAWITEWMTADKFQKPAIPAWLDKARKHYRETVAKNYRLTAEVSRLLNIHNTGNEYDESERNARLKSEVTVLNNAIIDILMTVRKYTSVSFATRKAKRS